MKLPEKDLLVSNRRKFVKMLGLGSLGISLSPSILGNNFAEINHEQTDLSIISKQLLINWCDELINYQINDPDKPGLHGGIMCPSCARIHGRCADAIYPMMHLAKTTKDPKYLQSAILLFNWMEQNVSQADGSWTNDVNVSKWNGITVFGAISLGEAIHRHGDLLPVNIKKRWLARLRKAADFIHQTFHIEYSNVNYPITGAFALQLMGDIFEDTSYTEHAKKLAHQSLRFITPKNKLLYGEGGGDRYTVSPKGCLPIDLGYNVEESLPALVMYGLNAKDETVLQKVTESLEAHMEFMLPDGAWDNSWGTRSFKWTYWGSRTSDGCQTAYALLANRNPAFYKVALQNTKLLEQCTHNGLLHGGPHYHSHGVLPCTHHSFCHAKALATILDHGVDAEFCNPSIKLPREEAYGIKKFEDIQSWLVSNKNWKGTIIGYDREYKFKNGHPSGGALSMLWHQKLGPVLASSMNTYQLIEATNMQSQRDPFSGSLTCRLQTKDGKFMNISDLSASIKTNEADGTISIETNSKLVDGNQNSPATREINCKINYQFSDEKIRIAISHDAPTNNLVEFILPVISNSTETIQKHSANNYHVKKEKASLSVLCNSELNILPTLKNKNRIFNHVPGMEAIPFIIEGNQIEIELVPIKI